MEDSQNVEEDSLMKAIKFYQSGLHRYMERNDEFKMLHSLSKLSRYPIKVSHLKETGVGRTVNLLVKIEGKVGEEANSLINKWKQMVEKEKADQDSSDDASQNSPDNQPQYEENSEERYSKYKKSSSEIKSESDEEQNSKSKSQVGKENRSTDRHGTRKDKRQDSSERYKHKSSHDRRENNHISKSEREHSSRRDKEEEDERSSKEKDRDNDDRREKEKDRNRDRRHKENGEKGKKEKEERKGKEHKSHREKERSERNEKEEKTRKEMDRNERREREERSHREKDDKQKEEKTHKEKDRKNDDDDKKDKDKKSSSSSNGKKDKTSSSKNRRTEISSESGTSFADALGMMEIPRKHKKSDKKESTSSSKHQKNDTVVDSPIKEKKCDKKESSSSSRHNKAEKSPKLGDSSGMVDTPKKERKSEKKESSRHHKSEISSESGTSFEDALGRVETPKKEKKATKRDNSVLYDSEICSSSGTSFEAALGMMVVPKKKKKFSDRQVERSPSPVEEGSPVLPLPTVPLDKIDLNISSLLPSITPNYRPIRVLDSKHPVNELETLNSFMTNKHQRTKIYSGNKSFYAKVPSLFDICVQLLQIHIDAIEGTGGVPYSILKPVLDKATPNQLLRLEYYNSYLTEDSDELWQLHCQKDFRREKRAECETWREMYTRCTEERETRLLTLTANIKQSREKSVPVRQTKIAYIDPPSRNTSRRQVKHLPSAPMAKAKVESMVRDSKASSDVVVTHHVKAARGFGASSSSSSSAAPSASAGTSSSQAKIKKVAPLMAKSLSAFKNRFKR